MALQGKLQDFSITQLLTLVNLAKKTGTMIVETSAHKAWITFKEGKLAFSQIDDRDNTLAGVLQQNRKITANQYRILKQRSDNLKDKELGLLLINAGYLSQSDIISSLQNHFVNHVRETFAWSEGEFYFDMGSLPPEDKITVRIDLENLIIEASRELKAIEQLQDEIPSLEMTMRFTDRPGTNIRDINLSVEEWQVVAYVSPKNTLAQIAKAAKMNDVQIRRVVYGLLQAGLVELVRPESQQRKVMGPMFSTEDKAEQKSFLNRIVNRIRSI
jgi:hypothetical protein